MWVVYQIEAIVHVFECTSKHKIVISIMANHGCEEWGQHLANKLKRFRLIFCKKVLSV